MLPIYGGELAQFPISLLFFPDSRISMSLLGLSLPSQWIWSSEDQALERQRAPAAPTSPHPSLYPSLSPRLSFSLFIPRLAWLGDILTFPVGFLTWPAAETLAMEASDGEIVVFHLHPEPSTFLRFCVWDDTSTIYVIRLIQRSRVAFNLW